MDNDIKPVLRKQANWEDLYFYQKSNVLYQMTFVFTKRFLTRGYRTNQREEITRLTRELEAANRRIAELEAKLAARG